MSLAMSAQSLPQSPRVNTRTPTTPQSPKGGPRRASSTNRKRSTEIPDTKARRVRTGCLTCRERHLKCDEALGRCLNCRKSDRICRRGVRLNFIDIQTVAPPHVVAHPQGATVTFRDDSRYIASEYVGGFERYPPPLPDSPVEGNKQTDHEGFEAWAPDYLTNLFESVAHTFDPAGFDVPHSTATDLIVGTDAWHQSHLVPGDELLPHGTSRFARKLATSHENRSSLSDPEQVFLLQVFVEKVGVWMNMMDEMKHFTHILPFHAIDEPMLLKAFMACGARHLALTDSAYEEAKARSFYDGATQELLNAVHDPNRDSVLCATAALVLNVYESMSTRSTHKGNHIAGSRALIRECGWTAKTPGLGGACFWISVSMELLDCLQYNWTLSWDPDIWGVNMDMNQLQPTGRGEEDLWAHRILYICAKVANFRVSLHQSQATTDHASRAAQVNEQFQEWSLYNNWCEQWAKAAPRSMMPLGYLQPWQTHSKSVFPEVWLIKRSAIISRLFYHTARILLAKAHPLESQFRVEMRDLQQTHAYDLCGLVAHVKDRGVANVSVRCLGIAAECLEIRQAQEEVLGIFETIAKDTGWCVDQVRDQLGRIWGWDVSHTHTVSPAQMHNHYSGLGPSLPINEGPEFAPGIVNPLLSAADFSLESHPYQGYYVAPHHHHTLGDYQYEPYLI